MSEKPACGDCRFWERWGTDAGGCKRYPPTLPKVTVSGRQGRFENIEVTMSTGPQPYWPNTDQKDWCGEFQYQKAAG